MATFHDLYTIGNLPEGHIQKKFITNEKENPDIIQVDSMSNVNLHEFNEGCFTFIIHHFVLFAS